MTFRPRIRSSLSRARPLSTFSIDVDTASYANVRRFLTQNSQLPPPDAVRIEELVNYFRYDYAPPKGDDAVLGARRKWPTCPWNTEHRLVRVGLKGKEIAREERPASNLVFLLDVSGSMQPANKLPLVREVAEDARRASWRENDRVAIVVYAGAAGLVLASTHRRPEGRDPRRASTSFRPAARPTARAESSWPTTWPRRNFIKGGTNRVILAPTATSTSASPTAASLIELIEEKAKSGVFLTVLGFGMGNLKDATLEKLADKGNGNYAYIDTLARSPQGARRADDRHAGDDRQGREDPDRVQPGARSRRIG